MNEQCRAACPYSERPEFFHLRKTCKEPRISLAEDARPVTGEGGAVEGELTRFVCGSATGPDRDKPSIPLSDYINTPHSVEVLKFLHALGVLPDQP